MLRDELSGSRMMPSRLGGIGLSVCLCLSSIYLSLPPIQLCATAMGVPFVRVGV